MGFPAARSAVVFVVAAIALGVSFPGTAHAVNPATKLIRGVVNTGTGWLEIPNQMAARKEDGTVVLWTVHGFIYGTLMSLTRTLYGLYDVVTFPIPPYDAPRMEPDTLIVPKHGREPSASTRASSVPHSPTTNISSR